MSLVTSIIPAVLLVAAPVGGEAVPAEDALARDLLKQLIETNTTHSIGDTTKAAAAMAGRLRAAGFAETDVRVMGPHPARGNLVARLRGAGKRKPILLLAHLDVVEARQQDWSPDLDPFTLIERDGYFYGRGTSDDKAMAAIWIANLIRYRREKLAPERDLIVALTADEEGGDDNGVEWLLQSHRSLIEAEYGLNEGGGGDLKHGKRIANEVQAAEKVYLSFRLEVTNVGGHSSLPVKDNAIYHLAGGLARLAEYDFPVVLSDVTRGYFSRMATVESGQVAADMSAVGRSAPDLQAAARLAAASPWYNAQLRTTCVATRLEGGHAENALPQAASAVVNCRMLPGADPREVERTLVGVLGDQKIRVTPIGRPYSSPPSPLRPDVMAAIARCTDELWPGVPVIPVMQTGATDGRYLRNAGIPIYGVDGLFSEMDDTRAHGKDERIGVRAFYESREFLYRLVKVLAGQASGPPR